MLNLDTNKHPSIFQTPNWFGLFLIWSGLNETQRWNRTYQRNLTLSNCLKDSYWIKTWPVNQNDANVPQKALLLNKDCPYWINHWINHQRFGPYLLISLKSLELLIKPPKKNELDWLTIWKTRTRLIKLLKKPNSTD